MSEFHTAVSELLEAFACGISIIGGQRARRKKARRSIDQSSKQAETTLSKSLMKSRVNVSETYGRNLAQLGHDFAQGDAEAKSAISSILHRLNSGFLSVLERFTLGKSTRGDYQDLVNLSNASAINAIHTFEQLSQRLSTSSLALGPSDQGERHKKKHHKKATKSSTTVMDRKQNRSKSAPQLSTPLGPATPSGWVRPKNSRKSSNSSSEFKSSASSTPKRTSSSSNNPAQLTITQPPPSPSPYPSPPPVVEERIEEPWSPPPPRYYSILEPRECDTQDLLPRLSDNTNNNNNNNKRKSIMSFASDSTKLGEIPEHKWPRRRRLPEPALAPTATATAMRGLGMGMGMGVGKSTTTTTTACFPLEPYKEPPRQRSRLMGLFRR